MLDQQTRVSLTRKELVSYHLRMLALAVDPRRGELARLAEKIDVHPTRLTAWINQGYVPMFQVRKMEKRIGKKHVLADELCPPEYRNS